ncbi:hypothetical protein BGY98DRAFT_312381 [Russula aff. rugulosa BPL654]|nr:hypothetical protein BGY98DRAFT_312381 [Russula aff. rugulosa BPL654]
MDQQQNVQRHGDLCIDGYISQMFDPQVADEYHVSLLRREPGQIQLETDVAGTGAFLATPPPGPTSGQHGWVVDYAVKDTGPVIRQKIWAPKKSSDKLRWVDHEQLHPPIFFIHKNGRDLGLPLKEAAGGNCMRLRGAEEAAPVGSRAHAQIRINWCGYVNLDWNEQISIQKQTQPRETISLETFAKHVARKTLKFMEDLPDCKGQGRRQRPEISHRGQSHRPSPYHIDRDCPGLAW